MSNVLSVLHSQGSDLTGDALVAIQALLRTLELGLKGDLPESYYIASIDPGIGKSLSVSAFLKAWKDGGFTPASSVLVALSRLDEIKAYVDRSGLSPEDFAVLTSDEDMNGLGSASRSSAPILFTTQQMVQRRIRSADTFQELRPFHFEGHARTLRIWDETMVPEEDGVLHVDKLGLIPALLARWKPEFSSAVRGLHHALLGCTAGEEVVIPASIAAGSPQENERQPEGVKDVVDQLRKVSGKTLTLADDGNMGMALIGGGLPFPEDFQPAVILDASGRVRPTYELWEQHRGNLVRLPAAVNDYRHLEIQLWQRGSGKVSMNIAGRQPEIAEAVAAEIRQGGESAEWLIVTYKAHRAIAELIKKDVANPDRIKVLTWGRHQGTNDFADISNVVLIGQHTYPDITYKAMACAASGLSPVALEGHVDLEDLRWGEFQHHLLQALCRASVRRSRNGLAGSCRAWIVATPSSQTEQRVQDAFPGCRLKPWAPIEKPMSKMADDAIAYVKGRFDAGDVEVQKKDLRAHLSVAVKNFSRDVLELPAFQAYLSDAGLAVGHHKIARGTAVHFEPYSSPGG